MHALIENNTITAIRDAPTGGAWEDGAWLDFTDPGGSTTGWMWIDATGSTLTARLVTTSGPLTDTFTITR